jgi:hypothetical protein
MRRLSVIPKNKKQAAGLTIDVGILTSRLGEESRQCIEFGVCEVCRKSFHFTPKSTTTSTKNATYIPAKISRPIVPLLLPSGVASARHKRPAQFARRPGVELL